MSGTKPTPNADGRLSIAVSTIHGVPIKELISSHYTLTKALAHGSNGPLRRALPEKVVKCICWLAELSIPSNSLSQECSEPLVVPSRGPEVAIPWFQTAPIPVEKHNQIIGVQLSTFSHDQGWVGDPTAGSWSWYQIQIVIDEASRLRGKARWADPMSWVSHRNRMASPQSEYHRGQFFGASHEMLSVLQAGDCLEITANARFLGWKNYADQGKLQVFVRWEPSPEMLKLIYDNVPSST
ncbi:hypothetical protein FRC07_013162 [Ceratobasidium sp. 392]|nr:hypothetical protein FRC07_013162 [Ceratobasidium sp. 392]